MQYKLVSAPGVVAIARPATDTAAITPAPVWKTVLADMLGFVLLVWSIPAAILVVGTPIVMAVALVIAFMRWILQP